MSEASGDPLHKVPQSDDPRQASGDRLQFPGFSRNSRVTEPEAFDLEEHRWMPKREQHASSSSGRSASHNPNVQASGDGLQSNEHDDTTNIMFPGVELLPNLVAWVEENLKKTFGNLNLTRSPVNTAKWCIFARDCMWASFQMSRSVDTCISGCQNYSFSNTQDILNILTGSFLENERDREPAICVRKTDVQANA